MGSDSGTNSSRSTLSCSSVVDIPGQKNLWLVNVAFLLSSQSRGCIRWPTAASEDAPTPGPTSVTLPGEDYDFRG